MAGTPSLTPAEAHAACTVACGERGTDEGARGVNFETRIHVRKWLVANGVPSSIAQAASLAELKAAWRDASNSELNALKRKAGAHAEPQQDEDEHEEPAPMASQPGMLLTRPNGAARPAIIEHEPEPIRAPVSSRTPSSNTEAAQHLAAALAALAQSTPIDADTVRDIVRNEFGLEAHALRTTREELEKRIDNLCEGAGKAIADMIAGAPRALEIRIEGREPRILPAARHAKTEELLAIVALAIPAYIVGPAGSGKTTAAEQVADALTLKFYMQGATTGAHEFLGFMDAQGAYQSTPFRQAFEHGGLFLADEIDGSDPAALLVINAALANGAMAFPDQREPVRKHVDFRMIAAANTFGTGADRQYVGRSQLDAATLDRFAFIDWPYDEKLESMLANNDDWTAFVRRVRNAVAKLSIRHVVSPRASIMGAKMLAAGIDRAKVEASLIWKGLTDADRARIRSAI
jgi:cobaltochelatase CobS